MRLLDLAGLALGAGAGASAWISLGTIAVVDHQYARVGALAPLWLLAVLMFTGVVASLAVRLRVSERWPLSLMALLWLPWLPVRVPDVLLLWEGPLEAAVWVLAIGGVVAARWSTCGINVPVWCRHPVRAPLCAGALFFLCSVGAGAALHGLLPGGDEPHYLVITQSLLYDGDLKIENNHDRGDFLEYLQTPIPPDFLKRGQDGEIYSVHAPGVSLAVLPAYALAGYPGALVFVSLVTALGAALMWRIAYELTQRVDAAWAAVFVVAFGATFFLHSFAIFPDPVGATMVAVALFVLVRLEMAPESIATRHLLAAGACLAVLPWLHTRFALVAAPFGAVLSLRLVTTPGVPPFWRRWLAFGLVPSLAAVSWFAFFWSVYGTPHPAAPYGDSQQNAVDWIPAGLAGLGFDQQFGILANTPALALLPLGMWAIWRPRRRLAGELALVALPYLLVVASFGMWWGGWSAPGRLLTCLMPLAALVMAAAWQRASRAIRAAIVALAAIGLVNVWVRVLSEDGALLYNFRDGFDLLLDRASRTINLPLAFPSIHRLGTEATVLLGCIWIVACGVALVSLHQLLDRRDRSVAARWTVTIWVLVVCAAGAMTASWRAARTPPLTPESSELALLHRWNPSRRPLTVRLPEWRLVSNETVMQAIELRGSERGRDLGEPPPLLALARVPAGDYRLLIEGQPALEGQISVSIGATSQSTEEWPLHGVRSGPTELWLRTPALVHSVVVRGDAQAERAVARVALRPERVMGVEQDRSALRAARYGRVRAFFLDDAIYVEPDGAWTRADSTTELAVTVDGAEVADVDITAGPVPAVVEVSVGETAAQRIALAAGERRRLQLPAGDWRVTTVGAFRPKDHDRTSRDARPLGVRIEFP